MTKETIQSDIFEEYWINQSGILNNVLVTHRKSITEK